MEIRVQVKTAQSVQEKGSQKNFTKRLLLEVLQSSWGAAASHWKSVTFPLLFENRTSSGLSNETRSLEASSVKGLRVWSRVQETVYWRSRGSVKGSRALVDYVTGSITHWNFNLLFWSWNKAMEQKAYTNDLLLILFFFFWYWESAMQNHMQHYSLSVFEHETAYTKVK